MEIGLKSGFFCVAQYTHWQATVAATATVATTPERSRPQF
jgi:hypothetical protein